MVNLNKGRIIQCVFIIFLIIGFGFQTTAQSKSNKGKEFWLGFMDHQEDTDADMSLYITSDSSTTGTVSIPGQSWSVNYAVTANNLTIVNIPATTAYMDCSDCIKAQAVKVTALKDVVVYAHHYMDNQSDATLVLPTKTLGKEYFAMAYEQSSSGNSGRSEFIVVAHKDNTQVNITPSTSLAGSSGTIAANTTYTVTLDEGEVYQVKGLNGTSAYDISGTRIEVIDTGITANCRTVAVFSGSSYTRIGNCPSSGFSFNSGDNLMEQMFPIKSWGSRFALLPSLGRPSGDNFRIMAGEDNTPVYVYSGGFPTTATLNKGQFLSVNDVTGPQYVLALKPVMVAKFQKTARCDGGGNREGDPSMTIINPLEQTLKDITVYSSADYDIDNHYIDITIPQSGTSSFTIDGSSVPLTNWSTIPNLGGWVYTRMQVSAGNHRLVGGAGFIATAYGEGRYESYGYAAGANVLDLTATIDVANSPLGSGSGTEYSACLGTPTRFQGAAQYSVTRWEWDFGDGNIDSVQNPTHTYADTGTYNVRLYTYKSVADGCSSYDSTFVTVSVYATPTAKFGTTPLCDSINVQFTDLSIIPSPEQHSFTKWRFDDNSTVFATSASKLYDTTGKFFIELTVGTLNQCRDTLVDSLVVSPNPRAEFTAANTCFADSTYFTNLSTLVGGTVDSFRWEFSDGNGAFTANPVHYFSTPGKHIAILSVTTDSGCTDQAIDSIFKSDSLDVSFTFNDTCFGKGNTFVNQSYIGGGNFTDTTWYTSDIDTFNTYNLSKTFDSPGLKVVMLIMEQDSICRDTFIQNIDIHPLASPNFSVLDLCVNDSSTFTDLSTITSGAYTRSWDFDDGLLGSNSPERIKYATEGSKDVTLTLTTDEGCVTDTTMTFVVTNPQITGLNMNDMCLNESQEISPSMSNGLDTFASFSWDVASTIYVDSSFTFTPSSSGNTVFELTVTTNNGCTITAKDSIDVLEAPNAGFTINDTCLNEDLITVNTSTSPMPSTIASTTWFVNGVQTSTMVNPVFPATPTGNKSIRLIVESNVGCKDTIDQTAVVHELPIVDFTSSDFCLGETTTFADNSTINDGSGSSYRWTLDGTTATGNTASRMFGSATTFPVQLYVETTLGCKDSLTKNITIHPLPAIDLVINDTSGCEPFNLDLSNNSSIATGSITSTTWKWGDGNESTDLAPVHTYTTPGLYNIKVVMTSDQGCTDSLDLSQGVTVFERPSADFNFTPLEPNAFTDTVDFIDASSADVISWEYTTSDGGFYPNANASHVFADTGSYNVDLLVVNSNGCRDSIVKRVYVKANLFVYIPNAFSPNGDFINDEFGLGGLTQGVVDLDMKIFNQWGEQVFQSNDVNERWTGMYKDKPVQQGVYIYLIRYTNPTRSKWFNESGEIHLVR